jgi:hypothetical protein
VEEPVPDSEEDGEAPEQSAPLTDSQRFSQRFEAAPALVVVGGATVTGLIVGALTTSLPMALVYLSREFGRTCYPWQASERVSAVLMLTLPGAVVGALWGAVAGLIVRWMTVRRGGKAGLGCLGALLLASLFLAVVVALVWVAWVVWGVCQ